MKFKQKTLKVNLKKYPHLKGVSAAWVATNERGITYSLLYDKIFDLQHLRIRRLDNRSIFRYKDVQAIKDFMFGEDVAAIQVFPKKKDLVDNSNTYHIWVSDNLDIPNLKELYNYNVPTS